MLAFFKHFAFLTDIKKKCTMSEVSTKNRINWDSNSINIWTLADEACGFTNFLNIT